MMFIYLSGFTAYTVQTRYLIKETKGKLLGELDINKRQKEIKKIVKRNDKRNSIK